METDTGWSPKYMDTLASTVDALRSRYYKIWDVGSSAAFRSISKGPDSPIIETLLSDITSIP